MASKALLSALLCALCRQAAGSEGPEGSPVSLVQSSVRVNVASAWHTAKGSYLVDNSDLKHKGPGVLLRRSKSVNDTAGRDKYLKWGTVFDGVDTSDGWVQYQSYFLPTHVRGMRVVTPQDVQEAMPTPQPQRKRIRIHYAATDLKTQDGSWVACRIRGLGSKPDTYNVQVKPKTFAAYNLTDVPAASLKKIQRIREFVPVKVSPTASPVSNLARRVTEQEAGGSIHFKVENPKGAVLELKMFKTSPMRTLMKMACERSKISWFKCQRHTTFVWNHNPVHETDHATELGMPNGETVKMVIN